MRELGVLLGLQARGDLWLARELVEHERHRRRGRVVTGEQQRHDLIPNLHVGERVAVLIVSIEQQAEDVLATLARAAAVGDLGVDQAVELSPGSQHAPPRREGAAQDSQNVVRRVVGQRLLEQARGVDGARSLAVGIDPEERAHRDPQREPAGPVVEVDLRLGLELFERLSDLLEHRLDRGH